MTKSILFALFVVLAAPLPAHASDHLIPAGALIHCTVSDPSLSSKTASVGDPVLCQPGYYDQFVSQYGYASQYNPFSLPYNSYLVGRFQAYKDPGHFVGKGWMELDFDHIVIEPNTIIPINAKVVQVPGYKIDRQGRILGKGHPVRDTIGWMVPVLWPIDLINLPRRGPRPTLKGETQLTLKVMHDLAVPSVNPLQRDPSGLLRRQPSAYVVPPRPAPQPAPVVPQPYAPAIESSAFVQQAPPEYPVDPYRPAYAPGAASPLPPPRPLYVLPDGAVWPPPVVIVYGDGYSYREYDPY